MYRKMQDSSREIQYSQGENLIRSLPTWFPMYVKEYEIHNEE